MSRLRPYRLHIVLILIECLLLAAGLFLIRRPSPQVLTIQFPTATPVPTPAPLFVHVAGAVVAPGVYRLPPESRMVDAVQLAGGLRADAAIEWVNLAAPLQDGQQLVIPCVQSADVTADGGQIVQRAMPTLQVVAADPGRININIANEQELDTLPGIGPALAARIVTYRSEHDGFDDPRELLEVSGIGEATYCKLEDCICVK